MKKIILFIAVQLVSITVFCQDYSTLDIDSLKTPEDFQNAESTVLECSNYLLSNPVDKEVQNRLDAFQYLFQWMEGTPDYTFSIGEEAVDLTKGDPEMLTLYFASLSKTVLDAKGTDLTNDQIQEQATEHLINFCANPENNLKPSKKMKKIMKSKKS